MKTSTQAYKGARDFYPEDKRLQSWMFNTWRKVVERYGYEEYDAPILEPTDLYLLKGSQEIINDQTYTFKDRGDRSVTIRTEMTPSVSRMVAGKRQELTYPLRWYSIPNLWRYERMQRGRLREFWQLNVDVFGIPGVEAEIELLQMIDAIFQAFKAKRSTYVIKVNSRKLIAAIFSDYFKLDEVKTTELIRLIDKKQKVDPSIFKAMVAAIIENDEQTEECLRILECRVIDELPESVKQSESVADLRRVLQTCVNKGLHNLVFDITLMRGFDYYTDIVFEAFDTDPENQRSLLGGGRYDGLVGLFGVDPVPTVGFAIGDVGFMNFLTTHQLLKEQKAPTEVMILVRAGNDSDEVSRAADELREMGVNVAVDYSGRKLDKQFKNALKTGVRYVLFIEDEDAMSAKYVLKDTKSGSEQKHSLQRIVSIVKDARKV